MDRNNHRRGKVFSKKEQVRKTYIGELYRRHDHIQYFNIQKQIEILLLQFTYVTFPLNSLQIRNV